MKIDSYLSTNIVNSVRILMIFALFFGEKLLSALLRPPKSWQSSWREGKTGGEGQWKNGFYGKDKKLENRHKS